ncbi:tannase/feruloyl esterase family alpha/beta hydrolase [Acidobacteria bacterium AH-259-O06]|nr:tannase/feruloyl esterase family alpha/beta hydrolase [Acidobacteria bacterium AH-259-O06]
MAIIHRPKHSSLNLCAMTVAVLLFLSSANAQNGFSFLNADRSAVPYTAAAIRPDRSCESLRTLTGYDYSIVSATLVAASDGVPEHCRVAGVIPEEIRFEVNLPTAWNGRFYMHGNGGYAGTPPEDPGRVRHKHNGFRHGFATAYTDTGHDRRFEPLGTFAYNNSSKLVDYAFRAVHLTAVTAKEIIAAYYNGSISYSYWDGCSTGGRQGLMSAQRFPSDFDGIVVGAPVLDFTGTMISYIWNAKALLDAPLSLAKVEMLGKKVYARCDAQDGLKDGLIDDPRQCDFDLTKNLPRCPDDAGGDSCFTSAEIGTLEKIYGGVVSSGEVIFPGQPLGAEADGGWDRWLINETGPQRPTWLPAESAFWRWGLPA